MRPLTFARGYPEFRGPSWAAWRAVLGRLTPQVRELYVVAGRGSGKSRIVSLLAAWAATRRYRQSPGEEIVVGVAAPDRKQARITFRYITALLKADPSLAGLIEAESKERIELRGDVAIEVITASTSAPRGRSYGLFVIEEASMLPSDEAASDPDVELVRAVGPALARVPGSLLCVIGSPYAKRGVLYEAARQGDADDRVVITSDTLSMNPTFRAREIERAFERDPISAASEYGRDGAIAFRPDVAGLLADDAIAACVPAGVRELEPDREADVCGHFDAATGSGSDSAALAIAYRGRPVELACVRRWQPPFSPATVIKQAGALLARYGVRSITIDRFAPGLVADMFREHGISCAVAERDTSTAFVDLLALVNSKRVALLDVPELLNELRALERRPGGGGRDIVGHPARGHDDVAAAVSQALVAACGRASSGKRFVSSLTWGRGEPATGAVIGQRAEKVGGQLRWRPMYAQPGERTASALEGRRWLQQMRRRSDGDEAHMGHPMPVDRGAR